MARVCRNLAFSNGLEQAEKLRDIFAAELTPSDISKAQTMARECLESDYKNLENIVTLPQDFRP